MPFENSGYSHLFQRSGRVLLITFVVVFVGILYCFLSVFYGVGTLCIGDASFPYDGLSAYHNVLTALSPWYDLEFLGRVNITYHGIGNMFFYFPIYLLYYFLPPSWVQFVWVSVVSLIAFFSINRFLSILSNGKDRWMVALLSLVYVFNPWMMDRLVNHAHIYQCVAFIPLALYLFCVWQRDGDGKYVILFWLASLFVLPSKHYVYFLGVLVVFVAIYQLLSGVRTVSRLWYVRFVVVVFLLYGFFWLPLLPAMSEQFKILERFQSASYYYGRSQDLVSSLFFDGFHASIYQGGNIVSLLRYIYVIVAFGVIILYAGRIASCYGRKIVLPCLAVLSLFPAIYTHLVGGWVGGVLRRVPVLGVMFSLPDPNYNLYIFVVIALASLAVINGLLRRHMALSIVSVVWLASIIIYASTPFYLYRGHMRKMQYPDDYVDMVKMLRDDEGLYNLYVFPDDNTLKRYWAPYPYINMYDFFSQPHGFLGASTLEANSIDFDVWNKGVKDAVARGDTDGFLVLMRIAGVRWIVGHKDVYGSDSYLAFLRQLSSRGEFVVSETSNLLMVRPANDNGLIFEGDTVSDTIPASSLGWDCHALPAERIVGGVYLIDGRSLDGEGRIILNLSQNYNPNFRLVHAGDGWLGLLRAIVVQDDLVGSHFRNFGMINSWVVDRSVIGGERLCLFYGGVVYYIYGVIVTLLTLFWVSLCVLFRMCQHRCYKAPK